MSPAQAFNVQSSSSSLKQDNTALFFKQMGEKPGRKYQLVREYSYIDPVILDEFEGKKEAKAALQVVVDNFNSLSLADGDSMHMSEDGMSASSFLHGKIYIKEVQSYGEHGESGTA